MKNRDRFLALYEEHGRLVRGFLLAATGCPHQADDLQQSVARVLLEKFADYDDSRPFRSWVLGIARIEALVQADDGFRTALMAAACDEADLEHLFGGRAAIAGVAAATGRPPRGVAAAVAGLAAVAATAGWLLLTGVDAKGAACRVVETKAAVLLLAEAPGKRATPVAAGDTIAAERRIWSCPWGSVALRMADGSRLQIDRDSEAMLECGLRPQIELIRGTAFVTRDRSAGGAAVLKTADASIVVGHGLAAVVVADDRTVVEVAEGETILTAAGGRTTRIVAGQVAVLRKNGDGDVRVRKGRLEWQLPDESPGEPPSPAGGS